MIKNPYLKNEKQDVEDIEDSINTLKNYLDDIQVVIDDYKDKVDDLNDEDAELEISNIIESYKETLKAILQKADLESKYYELTLDERIK